MGMATRPKRFSEPGARIPLSFRVTPAFKRRIDVAAGLSGRSTAQEIELRLEQSMAGAAYPPEIGALVELIGRVMTETGTLISGANRVSGRTVADWKSDPYAWDQAVQAAKHVLTLTLLADEASPDPHGLFAGADFPKDLARQIGKQVADGVLEVMRGRHEAGTTAAQWTPRIRERLGVLGDRLDQQPEPAEYWVDRKVGGDSPEEG
jgi:hypothetical protein